MRGLLAAGTVFVLYIVIQALVFHWVKIRRKLLIMLLLWAAGVAMYAILYGGLPDDAAYLPPPLAIASGWVNALNGLFVYWGLFAGYYQFVNMADNSVGVRSLIELLRAPVDGLTLAELERYYPYSRMLGYRLDRMVAGGFLALGADGRYQCRRKARVAATVFWALKGLLGLGSGG